MFTLRKAIFLVMATMLAAFALPSFAAVKQFSLSISGAVPTVNVNFFNGPQGNSSSVINSVKVIIPGGVTVTVHDWSNSATKPGTLFVNDVGPLPKDYVVTGPATIAIRDIVGTGVGGTFTVFLTNVSTTADPCAGGGNSFAVQGRAWSGNVWGGTEFVPNAQGADFANLVVPCTGVLNCGDHIGNATIDPTADIVFTGTADWALVRGLTANCAPVNYTFTFDPNNKKFSFIADKSTGQQVLVEYIVLWNPQPTVDGYPTDYRLLLAWGFLTEPPLNFFTPSLACKEDVLAFTSLPTIPNVEPFITKSKPVNQGGLGLTQYTPTTTAAMCQAAHGWGAVGPLNNPQVQFGDKVIDTDGFGSKP